MIRVLLADDHTMFRDGLRRVLADDPGIEVIAEAGTGPEVVAEAVEKKPDVVLLDIGMPGRGVSDTLAELTSRLPKVRILVLTAQPEDYFAVRLLREGADGYITKEALSDDLAEAIRKVYGGGKFITEALAERLAALVTSDPQLKPHEALSNREYQVLLLICNGKTPTHIAEELNLSVKTISTYRSRILEKMGFANNAELMIYGVREGLVR